MFHMEEFAKFASAIMKILAEFLSPPAGGVPKTQDHELAVVKIRATLALAALFLILSFVTVIVLSTESEAREVLILLIKTLEAAVAGSLLWGFLDRKGRSWTKEVQDDVTTMEP